MGLLSWIILGLLAGWIGGLPTGRRGRGCITTTVIGVLGALVGGALARLAGFPGIREFSLRSLAIAALGAALLLFFFGASDRSR